MPFLKACANRLASRKAGGLVSFAITLTLAGLLLAPALAHEGREVGEWALTFGWRVEPAIAGYPNGPEVSISAHDEHSEDEGGHGKVLTHDEDTPLAELEVSLEVEVTFGPASRTLPLRPAFGEVGHFIADLIPTRPGDYTFRVFGTIGDLAIDETFSSADGQFSSVEPASDYQFPEPDPTVAELLARIAELEARIAELTGEGD